MDVRQVDRTRHILEEALDSFIDGTDVDNVIEMIKVIDDKIPGRDYIIEVSNGKKKMIYSDVFIEDMLKKEFKEHLKREQENMDAMKELKELDIKVPSMEELKEICHMEYDMHDINRFISSAYKNWHIKPCCAIEDIKGL